MGVWNQIAHSLSLEEQVLQNSPVLLSRPDNPRVWLIKPALHPQGSLINGKWILKDPGVGSNPDKPGKHSPAETYQLCP